ncbi:hypothetical protein JAAARDRAFT_30040 [Jaapia argillacea MUCL 33604]|uniref:Uncharacterized protein n=1 Tax=Jaapia argillacea MUCL 33604 TaxID=933084 RepID=A0A067Q7G9_9AGAM|nr:hypothetical protein JAAARDRAFT_30040 [Jaapia argillacea MUCL 33604]
MQTSTKVSMAVFAVMFVFVLLALRFVYKHRTSRRTPPLSYQTTTPMSYSYYPYPAIRSMVPLASYTINPPPRIHTRNASHTSEISQSTLISSEGTYHGDLEESKSGKVGQVDKSFPVTPTFDQDVTDFPPRVYLAGS